MQPNTFRLGRLTWVRGIERMSLHYRNKYENARMLFAISHYAGQPIQLILRGGRMITLWRRKFRK